MIEESVLIAPGVRKTEYSWCYYLKGTKEALLSGGFAKVEWFPDGTLRNKRGHIVRTLKFLHEGLTVECKDNTRGTFSVRFQFPEEECDRRRQIEESKAAFEKAQEEERKELAHMPESHDAYRNQACRFMNVSLSNAIEHWCEKDTYHGYRYAPEVVEEIEDLAGQILELMETGKTIFSKKVRDQRVSEVRSKTAAVNPALRAFLDRVKANP